MCEKTTYVTASENSCIKENDKFVLGNIFILAGTFYKIVTMLACSLHNLLSESK